MKHKDILKASGERVSFDEEKLYHSLLNSGVSSEHALEIVDLILPLRTEGMTTKDLTRLAFRLLKKKEKLSAARYYLKRGLLELGPSGYAFETLMGELFKVQEYRVNTGIILNGKCVSHEVDVVARTNNHIHIIESKFHNQQRFSSDVKVPLYIHSRFNDIVNGWPQQKHKIHFSQIIATNTRFSDDAKKYANCVGIDLISWDYPKQNCLKLLIDRHRLYPLTCLTSVSLKQKQQLLKEGYILAKQLKKNKSAIKRLGLSKKKENLILQEVESLIS